MGTAIEAVYAGCANQAGEDARNIARLSLLLAGYPDSTSATTFNSLCASSLHAVEHAMLQLQTGRTSTVWAGGVENMSRSPIAKLPPHIQNDSPDWDTTFGWRFPNPRFNGTVAGRSMGDHGDAHAEILGYSREQLDAVVLASHQRAIHAEQAGIWNHERFVLSPLQRERESSQGSPIVDECPRASLSMERLARLTPLRPDGILTPAHLSPFADGVAGLVLGANKPKGQTQGLPLQKTIELVDILTLGTPPEQMPLGGVLATQALLKKHSLTINQFACLEFHEAFASAHLHQCDSLGVDALTDMRVNRHGGAFALGSPMGALGARGLVTLTHRLSREATSDQPYGVFSTCVGMGQGVAVLMKAGN